MRTRLLLILIIIAAVLTACNPLTPVDLNLSSVSIDTGINLASGGAKAAAGDVASLRLRVEAADMETVEQTFTESVISLDVEAGSARTFTLEALDAGGNELFSGSTTVDLVAGKSISVIITMDYSGYYVSFNTSGAAAIPRQYVAGGGLVTAPAVPVKTGYTFAGWYSNAALTTAWNFGTNAVSSDITLYAKWTALPVYTVYFEPNGGTPDPADQNIIQGQKAASPASPVKTNFTLAGWYTDNGVWSDQWIFATDIVTSDITLYAYWVDVPSYTVYFEPNGGTPDPSDQTVYENNLAAEPGTPPTKSNYTFAGWYSDAGLTSEWVFSADTVVSDITLYAKWDPVAVTGVTLNNSSLTLTNSNLTSLTATVSPSDALDKSISWSSSNTAVLTVSGTGATPTLTVQGAGSTVITATTNDGSYMASCTVSVTLYSVTYYANGGIGTSPTDSNQYLLNASANILAETPLTNSPLIFQSWNTQNDGNGTNYFPSQSLPITGNMELHAIWISDDHENAYTGATSISYPSGTPGEIQYEGDVDYFALSVPSAGTIHMDSIGGSTDVTVRLYDTDGTTSLGFDDDSGGSLMFSLDTAVSGAGTYYIMVAGYSTNIGTYTLNVSFTP